MVAFSIASLKVDGIRDDSKRARIFEYLKSLKYDFFLLQETHIQTEDIEAWSTEWGALAFGVLVVINPGVVRIVCNVSLDFEDLEVKRDMYGRLVNVRLSLHGCEF